MIDFNMGQLLNQSKIKYKLKRISQRTIEGIPQTTYDDYIAHLTVTNARKEDLRILKMGNTIDGVIKLRILNDEKEKVAIGDVILFRESIYKITRERPYQHGITDFYILYAEKIMTHGSDFMGSNMMKDSDDSLLGCNSWSFGGDDTW